MIIPNGAIYYRVHDECTCSRVYFVQFILENAWLFYCNMRAKNYNVAEIWTSSCVSLEWRAIPGKILVGDAILDLYYVLKSTSPVW